MSDHPAVSPALVGTWLLVRLVNRWDPQPALVGSPEDPGSAPGGYRRLTALLGRTPTGTLWESLQTHDPAVKGGAANKSQKISPCQLGPSQQGRIVRGREFGGRTTADEMHNFTVKYYVDGVGTYEEQLRAASETDVRRLVAAKFPGKYVRVIQVTRID